MYLENTYHQPLISSLSMTDNLYMISGVPHDSGNLDTIYCWSFIVLYPWILMKYPHYESL